MNRLRPFLQQYGGWVLLVVPIAIIVFSIGLYTTVSPPKTVAEPPGETEITFDMEKNRAYTAEDGIIVVGGMVVPTAAKAPESAPVAATEAASIATSSPAVAAPKIGGAYTLPENVAMADGSIGVLSIPKIGLAVNVYETEDEMEAMTRGLAHFKTTSAWDGNIGLCGHNQNFDLTDGYLKNLYTLKIGDSISYQTSLGSRTYTVETVAAIAETDWSYLGRTEDDRITLITCISGRPTMRLVVQATAK